MSDVILPSSIQVKEMIGASRARGLNIRQAPRPRCFRIIRQHGRRPRACGNEIYVMSYILTRPEEGLCRPEEGGCGAEWHDTAQYGKLCLTCGWSADHREGYGCIPLEESPAIGA